MKRRDFFKFAGGGVAALIVGSVVPSMLSDNRFFASKNVQSLNFTITDAVKEMVTHNRINEATCYFWLYKEENFPAEVPGPHIFTTEGSAVVVNITNALDEPHSFYIRGMADSGPIAPGETKTIEFIKTLPLDYNDTIDYFVATPYPGSRLWEDKMFNIRIIEKDFSKYDCNHIIFETAELNKIILNKLYLIAKEIEKEFKR